MSLHLWKRVDTSALMSINFLKTDRHMDHSSASTLVHLKLPGTPN